MFAFLVLCFGLLTVQSPTPGEIAQRVERLSRIFERNLMWKIRNPDAINKALDAMCNEVHNHVARICWAMQENRVELKEAMKNKASSPEFCKQIQMCSGKPRVHAHGPTGSDLKRCQTCTMCQAFTSLVKPQLDKKEPEKDLGPLIAKGCSEHFGNSTGCKKFVTHYEAKLKLVLSKSWDHITTCRSVGACNSGAVATATRDLADNKCKEGPESWCQSIESAINCNALSYCVKAWKI